MNPSNLNSIGCSKLAVPTIDGLQFIPINNILYIESDNIYCKLYLSNNQKINVLASIKSMEERVCHQRLIRIHKKYIVSIDKIKLFCKSDGGFVLLDNEIQLPVSRFRRERFFKRIGLINDV